MLNSNIRPIALYLPQYHTIPENDAAWGAGFTEWTNVRKAQPQFEGHYQPHIPDPEVGYYDLSQPSVLQRQATMAKAYGIYGFAYYHYWFNGKRLLNTPLDDMLDNPVVDMPFCYVWANENWTKRWDGQDHEVIIEQHYSLEDDQDHIRFLCERVFSDSRYIRIDNKPLFVVYRTELFPDIVGTADLWRSEAKKYGFEDLYLVRVESFIDNINPAAIGFDAAMEFAPNWREQFTIKSKYPKTSFSLSDYWLTVLNMLRTERNYTRFRCVFPAWDNTARRGKNAKIFVDSNPSYFHYFLKHQVQFSQDSLPENMRYLFINAWNEWGEGCHLEPDQKYGYTYLDICKKVFLEDKHLLLPTQVLHDCLVASLDRIHLFGAVIKDHITKHNELLSTPTFKLGKFLLKPFKKIKDFFNN